MSLDTLLIERLDRQIVDLAEALLPFAEKPSEEMDSFPCHVGITTKEKCGRCSRAIAAYEALKKARLIE